MPTAERQRFEELWRRQHRDDPGNAFALKTYFATLQVLRAIHGGARNRRALGEELTRVLVLSGLEEGEQHGERGLRYIVGGEIESFPYGIFGSPTPEEPPLSEESAEGDLTAPPEEE